MAKGGKTSLNSDQFQNFVQQAKPSPIKDVVVNDNTYLSGWESSFAIQNSNFSHLTIRGENGELSFQHCNIQTLQVDTRSHGFCLIIDNCIIETLIIVYSSKASITSIEIKGGTVTELKSAGIGNIKAQHIKAEEVAFKKIMLNIEISTISFTNVSLLESIELSGEISRKLEFIRRGEKDYFINELHLNKVRGSCEFSFRGYDKTAINLIDSQFSRINLYGKELKVHFQNPEIYSVYSPESTTFSLLEITGTAKLEEANFYSNKIKDLFLFSVRIPKDKSINFEGIAFENIQFDSLNNEGTLRIMNCLINTSLRLHQSNMGRLQLTNVNLSKATEVTMLDSNINDTYFNGFSWNRNYNLNHHYDIWAATHYRKDDFKLGLRESYRQLKANYFKNGNKIEALEFQKGEMEIQYQILNEKKFESLRSLGNFLIVGSNKWFSDFGQNIWKPLLWLTVTHFVIFIAINYSFDLGYDITFSPEKLDIGVTLKAINLYSHTLLPTHSPTVQNSIHRDVSIAGFWDVLSRIFAGYFIYYFISASRKYHQ